MHNRDLLPDIFEDIFVDQIVDYLRRIDGVYENHASIFRFIDDFFENPLWLEDFDYKILNSAPGDIFSQHLFLYLSYNDFSSYTPDKRKEEIYKKVWKQSPNGDLNKKTKDELIIRYISPALDAYKPHFEFCMGYTLSEVDKKWNEFLKLISDSFNPQKVFPDSENRIAITFEENFRSLFNNKFLYNTSVMLFYFKAQGLMNAFIIEIQNNILTSDNQKIIQYLSNIKHQYQQLLFPDNYSDKIPKFLKEFNINEESILDFFNQDYDNPLYVALYSIPHSLSNHVIYRDKESITPIQNTFYKYYYNKVLNDLIDFIDSQIKAHISNFNPVNLNFDLNLNKFSSGFLPSFISFLECTNIIDKYKSNWSCSSFYQALKDGFNNVRADVTNQFISVSPNDRTNYIDAHLRKIYMITKNNSGGPTGRAESCLKAKNWTLEHLFEFEIFDLNIPISTFPAYLRLSYGDFNEMVDNTNNSDTRAAFFHLLSDFFINKLIEFFHDIEFSITDDLSFTTVSKPNTNKKIPPYAFSYKKYSSHLAAITDMFNSLINNDFIHDDTDLIDFRKIFNNTKPNSPIKWIGNISELKYFVTLLNNDFELIENLKQDIWKVTASIFVDSNGNSFDWSKFRGQKTPAKSKKIETAVQHLK